MTELHELTAAQSFEQKLMDRLRKDIGDLMPDEVLASAVEKAMHTIFFKERVTRTASWKQPEEVKPSEFTETVKELLGKRIEAAAKQWIDTHPEEMRNLLQTALEEGIGSCVIKAFHRLFTEEMARSLMAIHERLFEIENKTGM